MRQLDKRSSFTPELLENLAKVDSHAVETLADFGAPTVFNPIIGLDPFETLEKLENGLDLLHSIIADLEGKGQIEYGIRLFVQTLWAAAQYSARAHRPAAAG